MEYSDQVVKVLSECVATAMKKAMSDTSRAIEEKLRNYKFSGDNIKQMSIGNTHILPQSIDNIHIKDASIDVAKVKDFMAEVANIAVANIKNATIDTAQIRDLAAYTANIANANIKNATIKYAQIEGLTAGSALIQEAVGGKVMIADLAVVEANMVNLTLGSLVLKGEDGCFYSILVGEDGQVKTELKQIVNSDIKDLSLNAGEKLIEGSITAACLNVKEIFANKALIGAIRTANLDAGEITANKAFIEQLATSLIESPDDTGLKLASQNFVTLHVPGELKNASVTIDKDGVAIVGGKITMNANTAIEILSGGTLNVSGGSVSVGANGSIALTSGGTISVGSDSSIKINSGSSLDIASGAMSVSSGTVNIKSGSSLSIASGGSLKVSGGTLSLESSAIMNIASGTVNVQSGSSMNIIAGGTFTIDSTNFKIDTKGNVTLTGTVNASAGKIGGLTIESSTLSDLSSTASTAKSTADTATTNIGKITNGTTAVPYVKSTAITISGNNMTVGANGKLTLQSNSGLTINTGGTFTIGSGNFSIDASGNVVMTGKVTASSGKIGGWNISTDRLYAGSGTSYVALNTNAGYPAIWAGNGTYSSAPFRVYQDGSVYITSLHTLDNGVDKKIDLRSSYWQGEAGYNGNITEIKPSVEGSTVTLTFVRRKGEPLTVNFSKASSISLVSWSWPNDTATDYSQSTVKVTVKTDSEQKTYSTSLNTSTFVTYGKKATEVAIEPSENVALGYGGSKRVYAKIMDGDTILKSTSVLISAPAAVTLSSITRTNLSYDATAGQYTIKVKATASNGETLEQEFTFNATSAINAGIKEGKDMMGVKVDGTTVSVAVSETKSATASVGSSHRIQSDGSVSLTPGQTFKGAPGTYYKNPRIVADHWINWT